MERAIAATNYSKGGCERIGVHLDDGSRSQNTKSNSSFWQSISVSGCIICCRYTFFDTLKRTILQSACFAYCCYHEQVFVIGLTTGAIVGYKYFVMTVKNGKSLKSSGAERYEV